jgi:histidinol-phosphate aminotransferase
LQHERDVTEARRAAGPIRLCYNENPYGMSPKAKAAIETGWVEHSRYDPPSLAMVTKTFATHVGVQPEHVLVTQGSQEVLSIVAIAYGGAGSEIVMPWPSFEGLPDYAEALGAMVHRVPLDAELQHDFAAMDTRITSSVKLVYVCNPNNPTGTLAGHQQLRDFVKSASKRAIVIVDEAYHDFIDDPNYTSMTDMVLKGDNVIVARTASKIHGMAGTRVGFAVARPDIIARLKKLVTGNPNSLGLNAVNASLQDTQYQTFVKQRNREGRELLVSTLKGLGKRVAPSSTNFVFFQAGMPTEKVQDTMRSKGLIIGRTFKPYTDWCRISIGMPDEMKACVAALPEALRA